MLKPPWPRLPWPPQKASASSRRRRTLQAGRHSLPVEDTRPASCPASEHLETTEHLLIIIKDIRGLIQTFCFSPEDLGGSSIVSLVHRCAFSRCLISIRSRFSSSSILSPENTSFSVIQSFVAAVVPSSREFRHLMKVANKYRNDQEQLTVGIR